MPFGLEFFGFAAHVAVVAVECALVAADGHSKVHDFAARISSMASSSQAVFREVRRVLTKDGSLWLNLGDKYVNKNFTGIPWRVAIALQDDGWVLRAFHFVKHKKYYYAADETRITSPVRVRDRNGAMVSATGVSGKKYREQIANSPDLSPA